MRILVISDTHGLLRHELTPLMQGCELIIHAGDFGTEENYLFFRNSGIPLRAVRGNVDRGAWASALPHDDFFTTGNINFHLVHNIDEITIDPFAANARFVVFGHSHRPELTTKKHVRYLNPGSFGPRRFDLPITAAWIHAGSDGSASVTVEFLKLGDNGLAAFDP